MKRSTAHVSRSTIHLILTLSFVLLATGPAAWAGAKEEVAAAGAKWAELFVIDDPDPILALYDDETGVLWGTLSPVRLDGKPGIRGYFERAFKALPGHKVAFGDQNIRVLGDTAVNTGYYTFSFTKDGEAKSLPARYSFTYVKRPWGWMIVDHHSSAMPAPPK
ncbi:MAG: nuclear transport factor 2 family protein [Candidatus Methylomirabilaceae bacterium]